jgi:citrate synthase
MLAFLSRKTSTLRKVIEEKVLVDRDRLNKLKKDHGDTPIDKITIDQLVRGMRGVKGLLTETSRLDPIKGIKFRGLSIPECQLKLPARYREPLPESMFWLLLTGQVPTPEEAEELRLELATKAKIPDNVRSLINSLPKNMHPMTQLSIGTLALGENSLFDTAYDKGMRKSEYWKPMLEDCINLVAKLPAVAALIYRNVYKDGKIEEPCENADLSENYGRMLGWEDYNFFEMLRLNLTIHCDHEGGNVSTHSTHLVGSALSDAYKSYSAGLNGLAGPLHGLANQECLKWLLDLQAVVGDNPSENSVEVYVRETVKKGAVIPGYGHAVLRNTDPRFIVQMEFVNKVIEDSPLCKLVEICYHVVPKILKDLGKVQNPYPNVDAHSGAIMYYYGLTEFDFFTVNFGVSRAIGCAANLVWDRALQLPIERPASLTLENLEEIANKP